MLKQRAEWKIELDYGNSDETIYARDSLGWLNTLLSRYVALSAQLLPFTCQRLSLNTQEL